MSNKKDYKKLYGELDMKYDFLLERHIETMKTLCYVRDLINDLQRTEKYDDVYIMMSRRVIRDIKESVFDNIAYEENIQNRQRNKGSKSECKYEEE